MCCPVQGVPRAGDQWCAAQGDSERVRTLRRTDLYVCVSHAIGAKARGSVSAAEIEFKHRVQRKKRGAELVLFERACQGSLWPCEPTSVATPGANTAAAPDWQWSKVRVPRPPRETVESVPSQSPANQVLADVKTIVEQNEWGQDTVPGRGATVVALTKSRLMYKVRSIDSCHHYAGSSVMFTILCALCSRRARKGMQPILTCNHENAGPCA